MPLIPVGTEYTASATDLLEFEFECVHCGARARASVLTTSYGVTMGAPLGIGSAERGARAQELALAGLTKEGNALAGLARCPKCRVRDSREVRRAWLYVAPLAVLLGVLIGAPVSIFGILLRVSPWLLGTAIAISVAPVYAWRKVHARCVQADRFVEFKTASEQR
jgi:hypothetical protein